MKGLHGSHVFFSMQAKIRISPIQRHQYITSSYTFLKKIYFVPHCSIVFRIPPSPFSQRELHFLPKPLFNGLYTPFGSPVRGTETSGSGDVTALRCSEPLRYKVGGPKRSSPCFAGWDRLTIACLVGLLFLFLIAVSLCTCRRSNEEYCFILLLIGLHLGRCPSELWRKSYDRHWRLMNDHNDRGCHL